jgi:hypothetical protein
VPDPESAARASLIRSLVIYGAFLVADVVVIAWVLSVGIQGAAYVTTTIVGVVGLLLAYQVVQHVRDLRAPLAESEGTVTRKWKNADLIIAWDSYYIRVDRAVFRIKPEHFLDVRENSYVKVVHFPNTLNVVSVHELQAPTG